MFKSLGFHKGEEDGQDDETEAYEVVPADGLPFEDGGHNDREHKKGDALLYNLELHEGERPAGDLRSDAVGRNHEAVFQKRHTPREQDDGDERPVFDEVHLLEFEIAIPGKCHEDIRADEHEYGKKSAGHAVS